MSEFLRCRDCKHDKGKCVGSSRRGSHKNCFEPREMTNADRIRAMSDEELASALVQYKGTEKRIIPYGLYEYIFRGPNGKRCGTRDYAVQLWLDWLQSPEEET